MPSKPLNAYRIIMTTNRRGRRADRDTTLLAYVGVVITATLVLTLPIKEAPITIKSKTMKSDVIVLICF